MTSAELLQRVREMLRDNVQPYLFTDESIYLHLTEAQIKFCQATHVLVDHTTYTVTTEADTAVYPLDKHILRVYGARVSGEASGLVPVVAHPRKLLYSSSRGMPICYAMDYGVRTLALLPVPDAAYEIELMAAVRPSDVISESSEPVIPEEYVPELAFYACSRLTAHFESDAGNPKAAADFDMRWLTALRDAKREVYNYRTGETVEFPKTT
jgi:hypothetical protein